MLSKARVKFIKSLQLKKYRKQEQCFVVEGAKSVLELLTSDFSVTMVIATPSFLDAHQRVLQTFKGEVIGVSDKELVGLGAYRTSQAALAVAKLRADQQVRISENEYVLVLDDIQDPGNLGTIIRTADWYGIHKIVASEQTADIYNSKVIQASMGSFTRAQIMYTDLPVYLAAATQPILGAFLEGADVHHFEFPSGGFLVVGNEGNGISPEVEQLVTHRITILKYGVAESLNAAIATAVICDNLRRLENT